MSTKHVNTEGGPAFPVSIPGAGDNGWHGMSLRDYFAGQALASGIATGEAREWELSAWFGRNAACVKKQEIAAAQAYAFADAMLERRAKR